MKTTVSLLVLALLGGATTAQAQLFRPETVGGAALGALAGGIIGNNSGSHNGGRGAAIGALAGGLLGSAVGSARDQRRWDERPGSAYPAGNYTYGQPVYVYSSPRPSYAPTTTLLGGVAGAIIGHNNGRHGWEGAAIGAGAGYVLGKLGESAVGRQRASQPYLVRYPYYTQAVAPAPAQAPAQITIINNYYSSPTPMSGANGMFGR